MSFLCFHIEIRSIFKTTIHHRWNFSFLKYVFFNLKLQISVKFSFCFNGGGEDTKIPEIRRVHFIRYLRFFLIYCKRKVKKKETWNI